MVLSVLDTRFSERKHGLALRNIRLPIVVIYVIADIGSVAGGWFSSWLIHRGKSVNLARKSALLICALCVVPIVFAYNMESLWGAVLLIGLAAAGHQGFSANLFTLPSDTFRPRPWVRLSEWAAWQARSEAC